MKKVLKERLFDVSGFSYDPTTGHIFRDGKRVGEACDRYAKNTCKGVSGDLNHKIADQRPKSDLADARTGAGAQRALTGGDGCQ